MISSQDRNEARAIMVAFAERTGLLNDAHDGRRYLWTDAFAVCNFLSLFELTGDDSYAELAKGLIDRVHETLGRHRSDDARSGWISGLDEEEGRRHPTTGGLRIGKPLKERSAGQAQNDREEWDRDGQYFHYLTKWMRALARMAAATSDVDCLRWALELAQAAHAAFVYRTADEATNRMYWKMSIDLSRPLVSSMGHHDPLDAWVTYGELENARAVHFSGAALPDLWAEIGDAAAMCAGRSWVTEDPLGIGGLLVDMSSLSRGQVNGFEVPAELLNRLTIDAHASLSLLASAYRFDAEAEYRLAFRELGLSIGLRAIEDVNTLRGNAAPELNALMRFVPLAQAIESFWRIPSNRSQPTWLDHLDINAVMLAASLLSAHQR
jgi:hypothetical protein